MLDAAMLHDVCTPGVTTSQSTDISTGLCARALRAPKSEGTVTERASTRAAVRTPIQTFCDLTANLLLLPAHRSGTNVAVKGFAASAWHGKRVMYEGPSLCIS